MPYKGAIHKVCHRCGDFPSEWVRFYEDDSHEALCFTCWRPLADQRLVKVVYWINRYGREMYAPGASRP